MNDHFSAEVTRYLSAHVESTEKSKNFLKLIQLLQFVALTNKKANSIYIYKSDPFEFAKTAIRFFKYDYDDLDIETLKNLGYVVTPHEKSPEFWLYGVVKNYYEISWNKN